MEATQPKLRTHCSVCGQKVVRQDMPYCIYCGQHFELMEAGAADRRKETRNMARLAKMPEHPDYAQAMAATPGEGPELDGWRRRARGNAAIAAVGLILLAIWAAGDRDGFVTPAVGALVLGVFGWRALGAWRLQRGRLALPMLKRPVVVTDRRSETELRFNTGITTYYFRFEFSDGNEAEFRYPGRGAHTDPLSKGVTGIAYTRGPELIEFRQIRV